MTQRSEEAADLTAAYRGLSGVLLSDESVQSALHLVTTLATETVPAAPAPG